MHTVLDRPRSCLMSLLISSGVTRLLVKLEFLELFKWELVPRRVGGGGVCHDGVSQQRFSCTFSWEALGGLLNWVISWNVYKQLIHDTSFISTD